MRRISIKARTNSFRYAFRGIQQFFEKEHNAWPHLAGTIIVVILSIVFSVTRTELLALVIVTGSVWTAELFNTAIEKTADLISLEDHPGIKFIKDVSAAAVLISAVTALVTGCIVFIPKF